MKVYKKFLFPLISRFDAERAHNLSIWLLETAVRQEIGRSILKKAAGSISDQPVDLFGLRFPNPIGIAAGFDKDGRSSDALALLGFGHIEVGTLTPQPQYGSEKPRLFRLPKERALVNRMGFPNKGAMNAAARLKARADIGRRYILGVSIGKQKETPLPSAYRDYIEVMELTYEVADYFAVNISSPNTPGLRELQQPMYLEELLSVIGDSNKDLAKKNGTSARPILVKISPDLRTDELDQMLESITNARISGVIASNTTAEWDPALKVPSGGGGLSGRPLADKSNQIISYIHRATQGSLPIIGVGGVFGAADVREKMDAGACLVQIYTGLIYEGPSVAGRILRKL